MHARSAQQSRVVGWVGRLRATPKAYAEQLLASWRGLALDRQFMIAASLVILLGMAAIGIWVTERIKAGVVNDSAHEAALYMDRVVAPLAQELADSGRLSPDNIAKLDGLLETWVGRHIYSIKIWTTDGVIAYSSLHDLIGRKFAKSPNFLKALNREVAAALEDHSHEPNGHEQQAGVPLIEIYTPIVSQKTGQVIAVAEFYEMALTLNAQLLWTAISSWLIVGLIGLLMTGALYGIVRRGRRTIDEQRDRLQSQIVRLKNLLDENEGLQDSLRVAYNRSAVINEQFLRRVSADLHDGPAQLISYGLLKLHTIEQLVAGTASGPGSKVQDLHSIRNSFRDALAEMRDISAGLALPDLCSDTLEECIQRAVRAHEERTRTPVTSVLDKLPSSVASTLKTCIYRFVQEALNNAFKHAGGAGQRVEAHQEGAMLYLAVSDQGPGITAAPPAKGSAQLGLVGLRDRVQTLGATLTVSSSPETGTRLEARFDLAVISRMETAHE